MLTLNDGRNELWQWDTGRKFTVDADCTQVHFSNKVFGRSIDVDVVGGVATIPDILLQTDKDLTAWAFVGTAEDGYTKISKTFKVNRRNKPADYVFTPVEQMTIEEIAAIAQSVRDDADAGKFDGYTPVKDVDYFDGKNGHSPVLGVDYWTQKDKENIINEIINSDEIKEVESSTKIAVSVAQDAADVARKAEAIAKGKATGYVFDTLEDMQLWLADEANAKLLNLGDNLYIRAINVPDYWWDGNSAQQLETQKVDLTGYMQKDDYPTETWTFTLTDGTIINKDVVVG